VARHAGEYYMATLGLRLELLLYPEGTFRLLEYTGRVLPEVATSFTGDWAATDSQVQLVVRSSTEGPLPEGRVLWCTAVADDLQLPADYDGSTRAGRFVLSRWRTRGKEVSR
jgi:hypothetical protein